MTITSRSSAKFTISFTPFSARGYDAAFGDVLQLQLETQPPLDTRTCAYQIPYRSKSAPAPTLANGGVASPPGAAVALTLPSSGPKAQSFLVRCIVNGGEAVAGADGRPDYSRNTCERLVAIRTSSTGARCMVIGETSQYSIEEGWVEAFNEMVLALEDLADGTILFASGIVFPEGGTFSILQSPKTVDGAPSDGVIIAQDAKPNPAGPNFWNGGKLTLRGGRPSENGDEGKRTGDVRIDLGFEDAGDGESARFRLGTLTGSPPGAFTSLLAFYGAGGSPIIETVAPLFFIAPSYTFLSGRITHYRQLVPLTLPASVSGSLAIDFDATSNVIDRTLSGDITVAAPSNIVLGAEYVFIFRQPGAGAPFTITWNAAFKFAASGTNHSSVASAVLGAVDIWTFRGGSGVLHCTGVTKRADT